MPRSGLAKAIHGTQGADRRAAGGSHGLQHGRHEHRGVLHEDRREMGGGSKERDDGILFTIASCSRRMRIGWATGSRIHHRPQGGTDTRRDQGRLRKNDYAGGIENGAADNRSPDTFVGRSRVEVLAGTRLPLLCALFLFGATAAILFILAAWRDIMKYGWASRQDCSSSSPSDPAGSTFTAPILDAMDLSIRGFSRPRACWWGSWLRKRK